MREVAIILAIGALVSAAPMAAEQKPTAERGKAAAQPRKDAPEPEAAPAQLETPPPYEPQVLKLAGILGSLAFLTDLCGPPPGIAARDVWRAKAQAFLNAEPMSEARRQRFTGAYNRGFEGYRVVYHGCTANARVSMDRLMNDGAALTREIASRFGG